MSSLFEKVSEVPTETTISNKVSLMLKIVI